MKFNMQLQAAVYILTARGRALLTENSSYEAPLFKRWQPNRPGLTAILNTLNE